MVDGFIAGLHRLTNFGFSQEFAEYRAYTPGDDLRHIDWNVYARTERAYLKRYRGETNTLLTVLLDASNSMKYSSHGVSKSEYARFAAAALFYLTTQIQRDAAGLIVFDDEVRNYIRPSNRQGQFHRLLSGLEQAEPGAKTDFGKALERFLELFRKRGVVIVVSDFYEAPERIIRALEPLRFRGNEVLLFHVLDPAEVRPQFRGPTTSIEMETQESLEVTPETPGSNTRKVSMATLSRAGWRAAALVWTTSFWSYNCRRTGRRGYTWRLGKESDGSCPQVREPPPLPPGLLAVASAHRVRVGADLINAARRRQKLACKKSDSKPLDRKMER